jgi:hypothetical protein
MSASEQRKLKAWHLHSLASIRDSDKEPQSTEPDPVEAFYQRVNARAEADILNGNPITGAHHRALEHEIAEHRKNRGSK